MNFQENGYEISQKVTPRFSLFNLFVSVRSQYLPKITPSNDLPCCRSLHRHDLAFHNCLWLSSPAEDQKGIETKKLLQHWKDWKVTSSAIKGTLRCWWRAKVAPFLFSCNSARWCGAFYQVLLGGYCVIFVVVCWRQQPSEKDVYKMCTFSTLFLCV